MEKNKIDDKIKEAELSKILAEENKINSERYKLDYERLQLEKPFYKKQKFIQTLIAGFLGGLAFLGILKSIIEPAYKRDIIREEIKVVEARRDVSLLTIQNEIILDSIEQVLYKNETLLQDIIIQKETTLEVIKNQLFDLKETTQLNGIHIGTIYFEYDKSVLQEDFIIYIKKFSKFLHEYPTINIELNGYSSEIGSSAYNLKLSERRAAVISDILITNGISPDRIITRGRGESEFDKNIIMSLDEEIAKKLYELKSIVKISIIHNN